jgi:hypothetical protein
MKVLESSGACSGEEKNGLFFVKTREKMLSPLGLSTTIANYALKGELLSTRLVSG